MAAPYKIIGDTWSVDRVSCETCDEEKRADRMHFLLQRNGDYGFFCTWKCVIEHAEFEAELDGERE